MIFISGAVLEFNYKKISGYTAYYSFELKRLIRLYPAFWMSLLLGLIIDMVLTLPIAVDIIKNNVFDILFEYTGFYVVLGRGPGFINLMGWFIAAIVCLYFMFPYLSKIVKKYQLTALAAIMGITYISRYLLYVNNGIVPDLMWRWFPLCNMFEFCLGIYVVQKSLYPDNQMNHPFIHHLAELSFYVFLFHTVIITAVSPIMPHEGSALLGYTAYVCLMGSILFFSWIAMILDTKVQAWIRQKPAFRSVF